MEIEKNRRQDDIKRETFYKDGDSKNPYVKNPEERNLPNNRIWMENNNKV